MQNPAEDSDIQQFAAGGCSTATDLLKTALAPRKNSCAPPNFHQDSNFNKKLDFVLNFDTTPRTSPISPWLTVGPVPRDTGMILWLPNYGANSIFHMGFVPPGTDAPAEPSLPNLGPLQGPPASYINGHLTKLIYTAPLALPYNNRTTTDNQVIISPNLAANFSKTRVTSGVIDVKSSTVPGGAVNLNGLLACGSLSDTRDIAQNGVDPSLYVPGSSWSATSAYSVVDLAQSSVTKKDGLKEVPVYDGVASIIGPDIPPDYTSPNINDTFQRNGEYSVHRLPKASFAVLDANILTPPLGQFFALCTAMISPWHVRAQLNPASAYVGYVKAPGDPDVFNEVFTDPIDETGSLAFIFSGKIQFDIPGSSVPWNAGDPTNQYEVDMLLTHFYASIDDDGNIFHYNIEEKYNIETHGQWQDQIFGNTPPYMAFSVKSEPDFCTSSFVGSNGSIGGTFQGGKYIGTLMELVTGITYVSVAPPNPYVMNVKAFDMAVTVIAPSVAVRGAVGPARVIRYDNVSTGQNLRFTGMANVQCIPQGNLAPFTQSAAMFNREALNVNVMPWLAAMFNGPLPISRNWTLKDYEEMVKKIDDITSTEGLTKMGKIDPRMGSAMQAAGLFSSIPRGAVSNTGGSLAKLSDIFGKTTSRGSSSGMASAASRALSEYEEDYKRNEQERQREQAGMRRGRN